MLRFAHVRLRNGEPEPFDASLLKNFDWLHVEDLDAERMGAPQNVSALMSLFSLTNLPVQFQGGVQLVHTAEMVLGLGVQRVAMGESLLKTENFARHIFSRFGESCCALIGSGRTSDAAQLAVSGCTRFIFQNPADAADAKVSGATQCFARNLQEVADVGVEGVILPLGEIS